MSDLTQTLVSYVPTLITRHLATDPTPITTPTSERFSAAVLFADISGFTALTERLAQQGPAGAEDLTQELNTYFGQLIDIIIHYGGDVVKFAGDALTAIWTTSLDIEKTEEESISGLTRQAAACALAVQTALKNHRTTDGVQLSLRIGLGAGNVAAMHVGGVYGRWEFVITGSPLNQVSQAEAKAQPGEVVLSPEAWDLVEAYATGQVLSDGYTRLATISAETEVVPPESPEVSLAVETALRAYLPGAILTRLAAGQRGWLAELRWVTVLFINLPNLTYTTPLDQAQMVMQALQTALYRYEGSVNKISVDDKGATLVAALGLPPLAHEDDASRGVQAALTMQAALQDLNWRCAIGVTTGRAFCGVVGNETRREYTMMGDVVNLAARLMQAAGGKLPVSENTPPILCDKTTYEVAQTQVTFETLSPIQVKGKAQPVLIYRPKFETPTPQSKTVGRYRPKTTMVGRTTEKMILSDKLQNLLRGQNNVVIIEGEAGIGKSRLIDDLMRREAPAFGVDSLLGAGDAIEKTTAYHAWWPIFREIFNVTDTSDIHLARHQVQGQLSILAPAMVEWAPLLNAVLPLDFPDNDVTALIEGKTRAENTQALLVQILNEKQGRAPLLLVIEDAHWLDSASWALLQQIKDAIHPLLIVIATRPMIEMQPVMATALPTEYKQLLADPNTQHLQLEALPLKEALFLICQHLGTDNLPEPVATYILEKTEGHPFFSEELAYALRDNGLIKIINGECHLAVEIDDLHTLNFPDTLQGVITSRIDRLTPPQQLALKVASILGRVFAFQILRDVYPIDADKPYLSDNLDTLERLDLTPMETPEPDLTYIFKHIITQEVAYNLMAFAQRRQLHQIVAEWYERTYADELASFYPLLAHHWRKATAGQEVEARLVFKTVDYLQKAGDASARIYANTEAITYYRHALNLIKQVKIDTLSENDTNEQLSQLYTRLGRVLELNSQFDEALKNYGEMEQLANERGDQPMALAAMMAQVTIYSTPTPLHDPARGQTIGEETLALARKLGDQAAEAKTLWNLALANYWSAHPSEGIKYGKQAATLARQLDLSELLAFVLNDLGMLYMSVAHLEQAKVALQEAEALCRELNNLPMLINSLNMAYATHVFAGEYDQAIALSEEGLQISQATNNLWGQSFSQMIIGWAYWEQGQPDRAIVTAQESLRLSKLAGFIAPQVLAASALAAVYASLGAIEPGLETAQQALRAAETQFPHYRSFSLGALTQLHLLNGNLAEAEIAIEQSRKDPYRDAHPAWNMWINIAEAELALQQSAYEEAISVTNRWLPLLRQNSALIYVPPMLYIRSQAQLALGQEEAALEGLLEAHSITEETGSRRMQWLVLFALSQLEADPTEAERLRQQARRIIKHIADHIDEADLRESFLNLPDVRAVLDE